ncbi:hypothetical protein HYU11_06120 [Candidatus Woesearchaeota archaeon]|nr:hypothetical protein [Candidatus Woesearchaeota archaeon]
MSFVSVLLFFLYSFCFGYSATRLFKNSDDFFERLFMRIGIGLGVFVVVGIILNSVGIPLDWRIFLALSVLPAAGIAAWKHAVERQQFAFRFSFKKSDLATMFVVMVFLFSLYMYAVGAFRYPYLENEDPWGHAVGAKYVSMEKRAFDTPIYNFSYMDPYPPGYDVLMGVLLQTSVSVQFVLKFFNALVIALSIVWFFFMSRYYVGAWKAAFASFVLAMIPSYFTHFIWAHSLVIALFFPAMYSFWMMRDDKRWVVPSALLVAAMLLVQPDQPLKLAVMILMFIAVAFWHQRKLPVYEFAAGVLGVLISLSWWAFNAGDMFSYATGIAGGSAFKPEGGSASRAYGFADFVFPSQTLINVPPGFGPVVSFLLLIGLVVVFLNFKRIVSGEKPWVLLVLLWFVFTFVGTNSVTFHLPFGLNPFRFWLLLAIPVALLAAEGAWFASSFLRHPLFRVAVIAALGFGIFMTSGLYKYSINMSPGWYTALDRQYELPAYLELSKLPAGTKVFTNIDESFIIGMDKFSCAWCPEVVEFKKGFFSRDAQEISLFMRRNSYQYVLINALEPTSVPGQLLPNETIYRKEAELANSSLFVPVYVHLNGAVTIFRVA